MYSLARDILHSIAGLLHKEGIGTYYKVSVSGEML